MSNATDKATKKRRKKSLLSELVYGQVLPVPAGIGRVHRLIDDDFVAGTELPSFSVRREEYLWAIKAGISSLDGISRAVTFRIHRKEMLCDLERLARGLEIRIVRKGSSMRFVPVP